MFPITRWVVSNCYIWFLDMKIEILISCMRYVQYRIRQQSYPEVGMKSCKPVKKIRIAICQIYLWDNANNADRNFTYCSLILAKWFVKNVRNPAQRFGSPPFLSWKGRFVGILVSCQSIDKKLRRGQTNVRSALSTHFKIDGASRRAKYIKFQKSRWRMWHE